MWFAYNDENWVLRDVSFHVNPGESVAIVGHTGAGKTTTTSLLTRFYDIQKGEILLDGRNIASLDLAYLRRAFAVVLQDVFLFSGTMESNIRLGSEISRERVLAAARDVNLMPFIDSLPLGSIIRSTSEARRCPSVSDSCWRSRGLSRTIRRF